MLIKNVISRAANCGMLPVQTARGVVVFNPVTELKAFVDTKDGETIGQWRVQSRLQVRPELGLFCSTYVDNLKTAIQMIKAA